MKGETKESERSFLFFATVARGAERALAGELTGIGARDVGVVAGGARFRGTMRDGMRACLELRVAQRVLQRVTQFSCTSQEELYDGVSRVRWERFLDEGLTVGVRAASREPELSHTAFVAQRTKDAIVDHLREKNGARPDVDKDDPDVGVFVRIADGSAEVYLDLSGASLHERGYRTEAGEAPLKETLAATLLRIAGYDGRTPFVDPMCGAGTIAIEAAMIARHIAPGLARKRFGFERWRTFDATERAALTELRGAAKARIKSTKDVPPVRGIDRDAKAIETAKRNAKRANVEIDWRVADASTLATGLHGRVFVVTNPPYGIRLAAPDFAPLAKGVRGLEDATVAVLEAKPMFHRELGSNPERTHQVANGSLPCTLSIWKNAVRVARARSERAEDAPRAFKDARARAPRGRASDDKPKRRRAR